MKTNQRTPSIELLSFILLLSFISAMIPPARGADLQHLNGHVPAIVKQLQPVKDFSPTNRLDLAIGLPLRNEEALTNLLREIYNPASTNYHHYLTTQQFTESFCPTEQDYQEVVAFAKAQGFKITALHPNRLLVDVESSVANIERVLHIKLQLYRDPSGDRLFHAPDSEPSLELSTPVLRICGLDDYSQPHPNVHILSHGFAQRNRSNAGSGTNGTYLGNDFRAAYVPGVSLTGAGQTVGLLEFDGYNSSDIASYEVKAGLASVTLSNVLLGGFNGNPTGSPSGGDLEVALDIEMAVAMAPGLSKVIVYEAPNPSPIEDMISRMASDNAAKELSTSWSESGYATIGFPAGPMNDQFFLEMQAQGQSFFCASGDTGAVTTPPGRNPTGNFPCEDANVTVVGGTTLSMSGSGQSWLSESVWNWGYVSNYNASIGSSGGYLWGADWDLIPSWQTNINMTTNQGSTVYRNIPDVAMTADNIYVRCDGQDFDAAGTSCAAPLWAGFAALVNQQAANNGVAPIGFINPAIYSIGLSTNYTSELHDITVGNNTNLSSTALFYAVPGYDLCTGWGTPAGQSLINALAGPATPSQPVIYVQPGSETQFLGSAVTLAVSAGGTPPLNYQWQFNGTNLAGATNATLVMANAQQNEAGYYAVVVTNTYGSILSSNATLTLYPAPPSVAVQPQAINVAEGNNVSFTAVASGASPFGYQWVKNGFSFNLDTNVYGQNTSAITISNVQPQDAGRYTVLVTDTWGHTTSHSVFLSVSAPTSVFVWGDDYYGQTNIPPNATNIVAVAAGGVHSLALRADGTVVAWGYNVDGECNIPLGLTNVVGISAGDFHNLALKSDGSVVAWGYDGDGECNVPSGLTNVIAVSAGGAHSLALKDDGTIIAWGYDGDGECDVPINLTNVVAISAGDNGSVALKADTTVSAWGSDFGGTLANPGTNVVSISAGGLDDMYVLKNGTADSFGAGGVTLYGPIPGWTNIAAISASRWNNALAIKEDSTVVAWVWDDEGEVSTNLGLGNTSGLTNILQISEGGEHSMALGVLLPPAITMQPINTIVNEGSGATFSITATGSAPLAYQWLYNGNNIFGATNSTYSIASAALANAGNYSVVVTNMVGSVASTAALLTVLPSQPVPNGPSISATSFAFNITGTTSSQWSVDSSTNLVNWSQVGQVTLNAVGNGSFTDTNISGVSYNFYKLTNSSYCSDAIGFVRVVAGPPSSQSYSLIANQLNSPNGNTLDGLFNIGANHAMPDGTSLPAGTAVMKWISTNFDTYTWSGTNWGNAGAVTLSPGEGAFLQLPTNSPAITVTFVGLVSEGQLNLVLPRGYELVSSILPKAGGVQSALGYVPNVGDSVLIWDGNGYTTHRYSRLGTWSGTGGEPVVNVGEGMFFDPVTNNIWQVNYSPCP